MNKRKNFINVFVKIAIFASLSIILYYIKFPLPFFPSFLEIQFSNVPVILSGFVFGPIGGIIVCLIRFIIKLFFSTTAGIGELSDLIIGITTVVASSLYYKEHKTKKGGVVALIITCLTWVIVSALSNAFLIMPTYIKMFGLDNVVGMLASKIDGINNNNLMMYYIFFACIPFNLILSTIVSFITFVIYKRVSIIFKKDFFKKD